jgi:hypothetical protein
MSRGPDLARRELWRRRLREFERGTATVGEFCRREGVSLAAFYQWRRKLAAAASEPNTVRAVEQVPALSFLPVEITGGARSVIEVLLPNGARVLIPGGEHEALRIAIAAAADVGKEMQPC